MSTALATKQQHWWEPIAIGFRWVAFIPGGLVVGLTVVIAAQYIWADDSIFAPITDLVLAGALGYTTVMSAAFIAPTPNKAVPAIVMAVLLFMLYGVAVLACAVDGNWLGIIQSAVGVTATAVAMRDYIVESSNQSQWRAAG